MRLFPALLIYRLLLPLVFLAAFPGWVVKMLRRGGFSTRLGERLACYRRSVRNEPTGAVHIHAVSVGESMLALKLIRAWLVRQPDQRFVLATGTATGHALASAAGIPALRVTYAPLDFPAMVRRYLRHFQPSQIVLIEGEAWPYLLLQCHQIHIPVTLVNARISPKSARRYRRCAHWVRPIYALLDGVAIQEPEDREIWITLGVDPLRIHHTGSLKFDPNDAPLPAQQAAFQEMLEAFGPERPIILAASTHPGEHAWIASSIRLAAPQALPVIVPRHAEQRTEVKSELQRAGFTVLLRSKFPTPEDFPHPDQAPCALLVDSTGELRDWTAHADVVIIGKSFLATGGQNPTEAILAHKPVICGAHMENFEPLTSRLTIAGACLRAHDSSQLRQCIITALDPIAARTITHNATQLLLPHCGATQRTLTLLGVPTHP